MATLYCKSPIEKRCIKSATKNTHVDLQYYRTLP